MPYRTYAFAATLTALLAAPAAPQRVLSLPAEDRPLVARVEPLWSVGGVDAPEWAALGAAPRLAFGPDGALWILDERNDRLLVGEEGVLRAEIGRTGGGPGEFQAPRALAVLPSGEAVVYDVVQRRLSRFTAEGGFVGDAPARVGEGTPRWIFPRAAGGVTGVVQVFVLNGEPSVRTAEGTRPVEGTPIQYYPLGDAGRPAVLHRARRIRLPTDAQGRGYLNAFFPGLSAAALPDGRLAVADTGAWEVTLVAPSGGVDAVLRRPLPARPVTDRDRAAERERLLAELAEGRAPESVVSFGGAPPSAAEQRARFETRIRDMRFPEHFPQVRALAADAEGRLWVERVGEDPHGPGPIDVVAGDGRYLGTVAAGQPALPRAFGPGGLIAWVETDALDVPSVRVGRLRLEPAGAR